MKVSGSYRSNVPRKQLWDALMDPAAVESCIPGVREFKSLEPDVFEIEVRIGVGAVSGSYKGKLEITDKNEPESYSMAVSAKGSMTTIKGQGWMRLAEDERGHRAQLRGRGAGHRHAGPRRPEAHGQRRQDPDRPLLRLP